MLRTNLLILFCVIIFTFSVQLDNKNKKFNFVTQKKVETNNIIDKAVSDGLEGVTEGKGYGTDINKDRVLQRFYNTLFLNLGIENDEIKQGQVKQYIPVIALVDYDSLSIYTYVERKDNENIREAVWLNPVPFTKVYGDYIVNYSVTDMVQVYDVENNITYNDYYSNLNNFGIEHFQNQIDFEKEKHLVMTETITNKINGYINKYNNYNTGYNLMLPIESSEYTNMIKDVSLFVFVDGIPIADDITYTYYSSAGSRVYNPKDYYVNEIDDGTRYYHTEDCNVVQNGNLKRVTNLDLELSNGTIAHSCNY